MAGHHALSTPADGSDRGNTALVRPLHAVGYGRRVFSFFTHPPENVSCEREDSHSLNTLVSPAEQKTSIMLTVVMSGWPESLSRHVLIPLLLDRPRAPQLPLFPTRTQDNSPMDIPISAVQAGILLWRSSLESTTSRSISGLKRRRRTDHLDLGPGLHVRRHS